MKRPVTVLMSVRNGAEFVGRTIESILSQGFGDFEFLILDNGSSDGTIDIVKTYRDPRIQAVCNGSDLGMADSWNRGISLASGEYIARIDADDLAEPDRLQTQLDFLRQNPEVGVVGSWATVIDENDRPTGEIWRYPTSADRIAATMLFSNPLIHPSVMFRRSCDAQYDGSYSPAEDYDLWRRLAESWRIANIDRALLRYRIHSSSTSNARKGMMLEATRKIYREILEGYGLELDEPDLLLHQRVNIESAPLTAADCSAYLGFCTRLFQAVEKNFDRAIVASVISSRFLLCWRRSGSSPVNFLRWLVGFPAGLGQGLALLVGFLRGRIA